MAIPPPPLVGVYLYLGFSRKDAALVRNARELIAKQVRNGEVQLLMAGQNLCVIRLSWLMRTWR